MPTNPPTDPLADDLARTQRALERAMKMNTDLTRERDEAQARLGVTDCAKCYGEGGFERDTDFGGKHDTVTMKCSRCGGTGSELEALRAALARVTVDLDVALARAEKAEARSDALAKRVEALAGALRSARFIIRMELAENLMPPLRAREVGATEIAKIDAALAAPGVASAPTGGEGGSDGE